MDEFLIINKYILPVSTDIGDDVALLTGGNHVITKDILVEGVHFLKDTPADIIAKKLLRVNLSDIAAACCTPVSYLLGLVLPVSVTENWWDSFFKAIAEENALFQIKLIGGDTVAHENGIIVSATMMGIPAKNGPVRRCGARVGDSVYVTGTLGDAAFGLLAYKSVVPDKTGWLKKRYDVPNPRIEVGKQIAGVASSCIDISDGLLQDATHICEQSKVSIDIYFDELPISNAVREVWSLDNKYLVVNGGDDYELLFTASEVDMVRVTGCDIKKIGVVSSAGSGVRLLDCSGNELHIPTKGFSHFSS